MIIRISMVNLDSTGKQEDFGVPSILTFKIEEERRKKRTPPWKARHSLLPPCRAPFTPLTAVAPRPPAFTTHLPTPPKSPCATHLCLPLTSHTTKKPLSNSPSSHHHAAQPRHTTSLFPSTHAHPMAILSPRGVLLIYLFANVSRRTRALIGGAEALIGHLFDVREISYRLSSWVFLMGMFVVF